MPYSSVRIAITESPFVSGMPKSPLCTTFVRPLRCASLARAPIHSLTLLFVLLGSLDSPHALAMRFARVENCIWLECGIACAVLCWHASLWLLRATQRQAHTRCECANAWQSTADSKLYKRKNAIIGLATQNSANGKCMCAVNQTQSLCLSFSLFCLSFFLLKIDPKSFSPVQPSV